MNTDIEMLCRALAEAAEHYYNDTGHMEAYAQETKEARVNDSDRD